MHTEEHGAVDGDDVLVAHCAKPRRVRHRMMVALLGGHPRFCRYGWLARVFAPRSLKHNDDHLETSPKGPAANRLFAAVVLTVQYVVADPGDLNYMSMFHRDGTNTRTSQFLGLYVNVSSRLTLLQRNAKCEPSIEILEPVGGNGWHPPLPSKLIAYFRGLCGYIRMY